MKKLDIIPWEILDHYLSIIKALDIYRGLDLNIYCELDKKRREIHDNILMLAKVTREDAAFENELADFCETLLFKASK